MSPKATGHAPPGEEPGAALAIDPDARLLFEADRVVGIDRRGAPFSLDDVDVEGVRAVLAAVDGRRSARQIAHRLRASLEEDDVVALCELLEGTVLRRAEGAEDARDEGPPALGEVCVVGDGPLADAICDALGRSARASIARARVPPLEEPSTSTTLLGATREGPDRRARAKRLAQAIRGRDAVVCALERVRGRAFLEVNEACLAEGVIALFVAIERGAPTVGPLLVPGRGPCFACSRLSSTLRREMARSGPALVAHLPFGEAASLARWKVEATAAEVVEELSRAAGHGAYPARIGRLWTLDDEGAVRRVDVGPVTTCPACGGHLRGERRGPEARRAASSEVRDAAPIVDEAGGSRSIGPEEASRRAEAALANVGVSLTLHGLPDAADPRLRAIACPYFAASHVARFSPRATVAFPRFGASAFGKGATVEQARCSALFEWIERNCAQWTGRSELVTASLDEVRDRALDVGALAAGRLPGLPRGETRPFDAGEAIDWVWGRCLRSHRPMLVPAASVFLTAALFRGSDLDLPNQGSSGLSAGCSLADATLQGLLEIVERDAAYTAMRNGLVRPAIDLASLDDPATRAIADRAARAGYELVLRDITSSLGVATVEAYLLRSGEYVHHFAVGYGAHLDPTIAARRAVTEAAQALYFDATRSETDPLRSEASYFEVFPHRAQALDRRGPAVPLSSLPRLVPSRADAWDLVDVVVERVTAAIAGCDVCVVDLSWPEMEGIFVVRCLVTGAFDEVRPVQLHVPERCRLVPLDQMYLGRAML